MGIFHRKKKYGLEAAEFALACVRIRMYEKATELELARSKEKERGLV